LAVAVYKGIHELWRMVRFPIKAEDLKVFLSFSFARAKARAAEFRTPPHGPPACMQVLAERVHEANVGR